MTILVERVFNSPSYCISHVYVDGQYVCDAIEDTDRMLDQSQTVEYIKAHKIYKETAIPTGLYELTLNIPSPKYSKNKYYMDFCKAKLPRVLNVPAFDGILIHIGNTADDSAGCLIVGYNKVKGKVLNSKVAFEKFYKIISKAKDKIYIRYTRKYGDIKR